MSTWKGISGVAHTAAEFALYVDVLRMGAWCPQFVVVHNTQIPTLAQWQKTGGEKQIKAL